MLHYLSYDPEAMWESMVDAYIEAGGNVLYAGDEKEMHLRGLQAIFLNAYAAFDYAALMRTLRYAVSEYLDAIGETRGVSRIAATAAQAKAVVTMRGAGVVTLQKGVSFTFDGLTYWETTQAVNGVCTDGIAEIAVNLRCAQTGTIGNGMPQGTSMLPVEASASVLHAVLADTSGGGSDAEADEAYRERIRESANQAAVTGPKRAYEAKARTASADILDVKALRGEAGQINVHVLLKSGLEESETANILTEVETALRADDQRPLSDLVAVKEATVVPYELNVTYMIPNDATDDIPGAIAKAVNEYKVWQESAIGQAFDPYKLLAVMYNAGAMRVEVLADSSVDGNAAVYTPMQPDACLKGTISATQILQE